MSVDDLMSTAGLTGGAFYAHFESKDTLFSELINSELTRLERMLTPQESQTREQGVTQLLDAYLTSTHVREVGAGCVVPALGPEIARANNKIKRGFETSISKLQESWSERLGDSDLAWATICQLVGTITVARAMASKASAERVIQASRAQIIRNTKVTPATRASKKS